MRQRLGGEQAQPGIEKTVSTVMAPETTKPIDSAIRVVVGSRALRVGVPAAHLHVAQALGAGGDQVVLADLVEQRGPHDQREVGQIDQHQRQHRAAPGAGRCRRRTRPSRGWRRSSAAPRWGRSRAAGPCPTANAAISSRPSHHSGIEYSVSVVPVVIRSMALPRFQALMTPR